MFPRKLGHYTLKRSRYNALVLLLKLDMLQRTYRAFKSMLITALTNRQ